MARPTTAPSPSASDPAECALVTLTDSLDLALCLAPLAALARAQQPRREELAARDVSHLDLHVEVLVARVEVVAQL